MPPSLVYPHFTHISPSSRFQTIVTYQGWSWMPATLVYLGLCIAPALVSYRPDGAELAPLRSLVLVLCNLTLAVYNICWGLGWIQLPITFAMVRVDQVMG